MTWEDMIPSCFGVTDGIFASHPSDEQQAKDAIAIAQKASALVMILKRRCFGTSIRM